MDDPETRDREPDGTEGPEPGAFIMRAGPEGSPETVGTSLAGAAGPGRATPDGALGAEAPTTAIDTEDATLAPRANADPTPTPVPVIPGYRVEGELGRGGMGVVYRARQVRLNRPVALKMILAGRHAGAEAAARFLAEAEAVAQLQHPNIVQIFHIDEHDGFPYFEMEYVGGGSLAERLDGIPRPPREAARLVETLARAMAEAHRRGVVHRDLKPANILLTPPGGPQGGGFGPAQLGNGESGRARAQSGPGPPPD